MPEIYFKKDCLQDDLKEIYEQLDDFKYFLSLDSNIYEIGKYNEFNQERLNKEIQHNFHLENIFQLQWVKLFGPEMQLEWKKINDIYHFVLFQTKPKLEQNNFDKITLSKKPVAKKEYLYGEIDIDEYQKNNFIWYEAEVPRLLTYPIEKKQIGSVKKGESVRAYVNVKQYEISDEKYEGNFTHYIDLDFERRQIN